MASVDVQDLIDRILANPRVRANSAFAGRTFADEPIIRRGSQMAGYLPERCRKMRELAQSPELRGKPEAYVFYRQARLMEDYTDDVPYHGDFEQYFPTYQAMSDRQLRGYFTWRAAVRAGSIGEAPLSFAFVHIYELLMGIGTTAGEQAFHDIERFWQGFRAYTPRLDRYVRTWLRDYAVWHGLDPKLVAPYVDLEFDRALVAMRDGIAAWEGRPTPTRFSTPATLIVPGYPMPQPRPDTIGPGDASATKKRGRRRTQKADGADNPAEEGLFQSFDSLSSYKPRVSRLHRDRPDTLRHVCCAVVVQLARHYDAHRKSGLLESLFGSPLAMPYAMFSSAVFWSEGPHADATYELDPINRYTCAHGRWYWEGFHGSHTRSTKLGAVLRATDQRLRVAIGYEHPLAEKTVPKYLAKIIDEEVEARLAWEQERERRTIHVDLSQLAGIRAAASLTQEALLVDEEREDEPATAVEPGLPCVGELAATSGSAEAARAATATAPEPATTQPAGTPIVTNDSQTAAAQAASEQAVTGAGAAAPKDPAGGQASLGLTPAELALLDALLDGTPFEPPASTSLDMLVDDINEKLFDLLGDTALEFGGTTPTIIEDYREDVRGAIRP